MLKIDALTLVDAAFAHSYGLSPRRYGVVGESVFMERTLTGLTASDNEAVDVLKRIPLGELVRCEITRPRNLQHHKKFFALLNVVCEATDKWPTSQRLLLELKYELGYVGREVLSNGKTLDVPRSISFAKMDQIAFESFYEKSLKTLCEMAGGIPEEGLRQAVLEELSRA